MKSYIKIRKGTTQVVLEVDLLKVETPSKFSMHQNIKYSGVLLDIHSENKPYFDSADNFRDVLSFISDKLRVKATRMGYSFTMFGHTLTGSSIDRGVTATHTDSLTQEEHDECVYSLMYMLN